MYEANNKPFPFWGAETTSKTGRDPLAVQNRCQTNNLLESHRIHM